MRHAVLITAVVIQWNSCQWSPGGDYFYTYSVHDPQKMHWSDCSNLLFKLGLERMLNWTFLLMYRGLTQHIMLYFVCACWTDYKHTVVIVENLFLLFCCLILWTHWSKCQIIYALQIFLQWNMMAQVTLIKIITFCDTVKANIVCWLTSPWVD